jgi:hypothetical protein
MTAIAVLVFVVIVITIGLMWPQYGDDDDY